MLKMGPESHHKTVSLIKAQCLCSAICLGFIDIRTYMYSKYRDSVIPEYILILLNVLPSVESCLLIGIFAVFFNHHRSAESLLFC
jgi:hypothetical protein